jgi:hypothetical protein
MCPAFKQVHEQSKAWLLQQLLTLLLHLETRSSQ